jgi:phage FluMu protein Com
MVVVTCKECGELIYLTPHAFWNITDFGAKCPRCNAINTITLEKGEPKEASIAIAQENIRFFFSNRGINVGEIKYPGMLLSLDYGDL